jgi:branched-chain amino acid transport system permease protein
MNRRQIWSALFLLVLGGIFVGLIALFGSAYITRVVITIGYYVILTVSLGLSNGFTGVFSIGHIAFMGIGAYTAAILTLPLTVKASTMQDLPVFLKGVEMSFLPATLLAGLLPAILALLVGAAILRLSGNYIAVATLGLLVITREVLLNAEAFTRGARTFTGILPLTNLGWIFLWAAITIYIAWRVKRSAFGRQMFASREDRFAAEAQGINILRTRLLAFVISAFFTGVAGSLYAHFVLAFSARTFYLVITFEVISMLVIGGMGSVSGAVLGAIILSGFEEIVRLLEPGFSIGPIHVPPIYGLAQIAMAILFILVMILRPKGLLGDREIDPLFWTAWFKRRHTKKVAEQP